MQIEHMKSIPKTRAEFERKFNILVELFQQQKIHFNSHINLDSILKVRTCPNKRIDFLSVDESARLLANMANVESNEILDDVNK